MNTTKQTSAKLSAGAQDLLNRYMETKAEFPKAPLVRTVRGEEWAEVQELLSAGIIKVIRADDRGGQFDLA